MKIFEKNLRIFDLFAFNFCKPPLKYINGKNQNKISIFPGFGGQVFDEIWGSR